MSRGSGLVLPRTSGQRTAAMTARGRYWIMVENTEPDQLRHALIDEGLPEGITYICGQLEQGTHLHYQAYVEIDARQRISWLKRNLSPTVNFQIRRGTQEEAIHYTRKPVDGCDCKHCVEERATPTAIPMTWNEWGEPTKDKPGRRNDIWDAKAMIKDGCSDREVAEACFETWCKYRNSFQVYRAYCLLPDYPRSVRDGTPIEVIVYYGEPGCGKSQTARALYPNAYDKPAGDDWFDGYDGHETILFDEYRGNWLPKGVLLRVMDRYPTTVRTKGSHTAIGSRRVVFTTNIPPSRWYKCGDYSALERRITTLYWCTKQMNDIDTPPLDRKFEELERNANGFYEIPQDFWNLPTNQIAGYAWN